MIGQSIVLVFVAMPLAFLSGHIDLLERYAIILCGNLHIENMATFEPIHRFFSSVIRNLGAMGLQSTTCILVKGDICDRFMVRAPLHLGMLAEALLVAGRTEDADEAVEWALALQRETKEDWCLSKV